jgi:hypothetical protein
LRRKTNCTVGAAAQERCDAPARHRFSGDWRARDVRSLRRALQIGAALTRVDLFT